MNKSILKKSGIAALSFAMASIVSTTTFQTPLAAQETSETLVLSIGKGKQINLPSSITDVFIADPAIADVDVKSARQVYIFAKGPGETTFYATNSSGRTVYEATIRVGNNIDSIDQMLLLAMPQAKINYTTLNGTILLTGTVPQPADAVEAERLVAAFVGPETQIVSRLKTATPLQVNLQVRIAEVSRSLSKAIGSRFNTRDGSGGTLFGIQRGSPVAAITPITPSAPAGFPVIDASPTFGFPAGTLSLPFNPATGNFIVNGRNFAVNNPGEGNFLSAAGRLFGLDAAAALDLSETVGLVSTLAQPNLTAVSGETGEFLAGGSFPIPVSSGFGSTTVEFRDFGVGLSYTPTVLADGRISITVRTEVSDISSQGAVIFNGTQIPAITTREAETTVELGSGQSFMIAGLLSNTANSTIDKLPGVGDIPIIGSLFKSDSWQKNQSELMIVITPYLVKPVDASKIKLPTDGFESPSDLKRILLGHQSGGDGKTPRPGPTVAPGVPVAPSVSGNAQSNAQKPKGKTKKKQNKKADTSLQPGFSFGS